VTVDLGLSRQKLTRADIGFSVRLEFSGGYEVQIESRFIIRTPNGDHALVAGKDTDAAATVLDALTGRLVTVATANDAGGLRIDLDGGARVLAEADPDYEAWTVAGPDGMKVVSLPGGGLSVWSSQN
jgi:hypothetical protein